MVKVLVESTVLGVWGGVGCGGVGWSPVTSESSCLTVEKTAWKDSVGFFNTPSVLSLFGDTVSTTHTT